MSRVPSVKASAAAQPSRNAALNALPVSQQAVHVLELFRNAKSPQDYAAASKRWSEVRPKLESYETENACADSGAGSDRAIARGVIDDLVAAPIELILAITRMVFAFAGKEKDDLLAALRDAYDATVEEAKSKVGDKAAAKAKVPLDTAYARLREALLRYLQSVSKRSRKHFAEMIDAIAGTLKGYGRLAGKSVQVFLTPVRLTPEWCGLLPMIDRAQQSALLRVFPDPPARPIGPVINRLP